MVGIFYSYCGSKVVPKRVGAPLESADFPTSALYTSNIYTRLLQATSRTYSSAVYGLETC
jgi:hypothetical protein